MAQNLSNLPIGAKVKFGKHSVNGETAQPIIWQVVAKNHSGYPSDSVTILAQDIIDLRAVDAIEPYNSNADVRSSGNNDYGLSNIDQWLNKDGASWYAATHSTDQAPDNSYVSNGTGYTTNPGFLSNFTNAEKNAILSTSIKVAKYNYTYETLSRKVFLPSVAEVGASIGGITDGTLWAHFSTGSKRAVLTSQCYNNTSSTEKPINITAHWMWWLRSANYGGAKSTYVIDQNGSAISGSAYKGSYGIRPALNLLSTLSISDTTDSDGCYTFNWNSAPPVPTTLNVPTIYGGKAVAISWSKVADPDGHSVTYQLEQSVNGGTFTTIYSGANLSYTTVVAYGSTNVQFRLKSMDSMGASSGYITSTSRVVINNNAPVISGSDDNLGTQYVGFTHSYTVSDTDSYPITVTEAIDGVQIRSYVATQDTGHVFNVAGDTWTALANGNHTMTITATDGIDSSTRTYTFIKSVSSFTIQNATPMVASTRPTRIKVSVTKTMPPEATFKVEVCNNGYDGSPTWEDATSSVNGGLVHLFSNTAKTAANWGVLIKVTVIRNGGSGACYVTSIGGNFE